MLRFDCDAHAFQACCSASTLHTATVTGLGKHIEYNDVGQNTVELWTIESSGAWIHPIHVHLIVSAQECPPLLHDANPDNHPCATIVPLPPLQYMTAA